MSRSLVDERALCLPLLAKHLAGCPASTREGYLGDVRRVAETMEQINGRLAIAADILELDTSALRRLVDVWEQDGVSAATIRRRLVSLRTHVRLLARELRTGGAILTADFPRPQPQGDWLPPAPDLLDLDRAVAASLEWQWSRDLAVTALAAYLGLSTGEMAPLDRKSLGEGFLVVQRPGGCCRIVDVEIPVASAIDRYLQLVPTSIGRSEPLFLNQHLGRMSQKMLQRALRRVRQDLGWPSDAVAGLFRRHRIRSLAAQGKTVTEISTLMGIGIETVVHHLRQ